MRTPEEIDFALAALGREPGAGLIAMPDNFNALHRGLLIAQTTRQRMPTIYPFRYFAAEGGFMSYGVDLLTCTSASASYVDRLLRGAKVIDLPVQASTKFHLVINLKAAKALGLSRATDHACSCRRDYSNEPCAADRGGPRKPCGGPAAGPAVPQICHIVCCRRGRGFDCQRRDRNLVFISASSERC